MKSLKIGLACWMAVLWMPLPTWASVSEPLDEATHVVTGKVKHVFSRDQEIDLAGVMTSYVIEIKVEKVEKGTGPRSSIVLYVHTSRTTKERKEGAKVGLPPTPDVPKPDEEVRVFLKCDEEGRYRAVFNSAAVKVLARPKKQ